MAQISIYRSGSVILSATIDDNSRLQKQLNNSDTIQLNFTLDSFTEILIGDYLTWMGVIYTIRRVPEFKKISLAKYEYSIIFEGPQYALINVLFLLDSQGEFFLTGNAEDFLSLIVSNLNRVYGVDVYSVGTAPSTEIKNLSFSNENCLQVLQRLYDEFDVEYELDPATLDINLHTSIGVATGLEFEYHDGLRNIKRLKINNQNVVTRLYAFGSERNLDYSYGAKRLKLSTLYIESNVSSYGIIEEVKIFDDIYPHFSGVVDSCPAVTQIVDAAIDFDLNSYLIEGETPKIVFLTGDLAGYEFEITDFNFATKTVTFKTYTGEDGLTLPSGSIIPASGDEFTFIDIKMPASYITTAETTLLSAANDYLNTAADPSVLYEIEMDWHNLRDNLIALNVGDQVTVTDPQLASAGVTLRILELSQSLANEYKYTIKVGSTLITNYFSKILAEQENISRTSSIAKIDSDKKTRRSIQLTQELQELIYDPDGYFDTGNIRPLSIETGMISVGMKSQQLMLKDVEFNMNSSPYDNTTASWTGGSLIHYTIDSAGVKTWTIASGYNLSLVSGTSYYIFARCSKTTTSASIILTTTQYAFDPGDGYYYFLLGVLHAAVSNQRAVSMTYGSTSITGRIIKTGIISSQNGATYFDLDNNQIVISGGTTGGFTVDTEKLSFSGSNKNLYVNNAVKTSGYYGRGFTIYDSGASYTTGDISVVGMGQVRPLLVNSSNLGFTATEDYGFEIIKAVGPGYHSHLVRFGKNAAMIAGWNIDVDAIYTGTKDTSGYSGAAGSITIGADGSFHAYRFYINADGAIGLRSATSDKRIEINSTDNNLKFYRAGQTNACVVIDDTIDGGSSPGLMISYDAVASNASKIVAVPTQIRLSHVVSGTEDRYTYVEAGEIQLFDDANESFLTLRDDAISMSNADNNNFFNITMLTSALGLLMTLRGLPTTSGGTGSERVWVSGTAPNFYLRYG